MAGNEKYLDWAREVLYTEAEGLREIAAELDENFVLAAGALLHCKGRVVITGMGKSGHIGRKMAATMASTGTPAFFVHPAEAAHGDLGMIVDNDVVVAISNSGESDEIAAMPTFTSRRRFPKKPARWGLPRPPAPPPSWLWAMRWRLSCCAHARSRPTISP